VSDEKPKQRSALFVLPAELITRIQQAAYGAGPKNDATTLCAEIFKCKLDDSRAMLKQLRLEGVQEAIEALESLHGTIEEEP
jgi:hypothetical protein